MILEILIIILLAILIILLYIFIYVTYCRFLPLIIKVMAKINELFGDIIDTPKEGVEQQLNNK